MSMKACKECKKEISAAATVCPHCGYKPRRTSVFTWLVVLLAGAWLVMYLAGQRDYEERSAAAWKAQQAKAASMTPEQKKAAADARAREEAEKRRQDAAVQLAAVGARMLKKSMNNPDSFKLESALVIDKTGAVCYEYRGQNAFGAIVRGQAVLASGGKRFLTNTDDGFARLWNGQCAGRPGQEVGTAIRWLAL